MDYNGYDAEELIEMMLDGEDISSHFDGDIQDLIG